MTQIALISGGTSGIGLATVRALVENGWQVYAGGLPDDDFDVLPDGAKGLALDITDEQAIRHVAERLSAEAGYLHALVNNAGVQITGALEGLTMAQIRRQFEVNVFGHLAMTQAMLPLLRAANGARIVNVSSMMGQVALPLLGAYSMSKHALEAMSDTLRLELAPQGIEVIVVQPGAINTPMTGGASDQLSGALDALPEAVRAAYNPIFEGMKQTLATQAQSAQTAGEIAQLIVKVLTVNNPKPRYASSAAVTGLITMRKIAPDSVGDGLLQRILGIK